MSTRSTRSPLQIQQAVWMALILRELKTRFGSRMEHLLWALAEPLFHIGMQLAIKVALRERYVGVMVDSAVYLVVAMIPFFMARNVWIHGMSAVDANLGLLGFRQVKPLDPLVSRAALEAILYLGIYAVLMTVFGWMGKPFFPARPLEYIGCWLLFGMWGMGLGLLSMVLSHRRPPLKMFIRMLSLPIYLLSGVLIPIGSFPKFVYEYLLWNPFMHIVELSRVAFFPTYVAHPGINLDYPLWTGCILLVGSLVLYRINQQRLRTS